MNALQIVNAVLVKLRQGEVAGLASLDAYGKDVLQALNDLQNELYQEKNWTFLKKKQEITQTTGTQSYPMETDFGRKILVYRNDPSYYELDHVGDKEWIEETYGRADQGTPYIYRFFGRDGSGKPLIWLFYVPDVSFNTKKLYLDYVIKLTPLAVDADTSPFDDGILIQGAFCKTKSNDGDLAPKDAQDYERARAGYIAADARQRRRTVKYRDF
jgi:hypothetical protein